MKRRLFYILSAAVVALLATACGEDPIEEPTVEPLDAPKGLQLTEATPSSLTLRWDAVMGADDYTYKYKDVAGTMHISDNTDQVSVTIEGLVAAKEYMFAVRANNEAGGGTYTEWLTVATTSEGGDEPGNDDPNNDDPNNDDPNNDDPEIKPEKPDNARWELPEWENDGVVRAFPGAEGGGMYTTGGRGGAVYHVTNLNDSGSGSLRDAINKSGVRTIVFDVSGTIHLKSTLRIKNGNLTIAGQTAPGDGICIAGRTVQVDADNVIIRFVRFRLGNEDTSQEDAIWGRYHSNIILDHCSMSWSIDEGSSFYANRNFTMQWCMVAEALKNAGHKKGAHGYGGIWGGKNASFHHNMLAHNDSRNPRFCHPEVYDTYVTTHRGNCDYRNNVVYNWGGNSTYGGEGGKWNVVGNYYKPGPASRERKYFVDSNGIYSSKTDYGYATMYVSGNYHAGSYASSINEDNWSGIYLHDGTKPSNHNSWKSTSLLPIRKDDTQQCYATTHSAQQAFDQVMAYVGASLDRDSVDSRIVGEAKAGNYTNKGSNGGTNGIIDSHNDAGGWPTLSATNEELSKVKDSDSDGMPDWFEKEFKTNPNDAADGNATTLDAEGLYTNLEIYMHYLVRHIVNAQAEGGNYAPLR